MSNVSVVIILLFVINFPFGTFISILFWNYSLSYAPTFFPPEYVRRFLEPFNTAPPVPFEEVHKILQEELGRPRDSVYEYVDPTQLASASIAQVCSYAFFF